MKLRSQAHLELLVKELVKLSAEAEWVEFKVNNDNPDDIGTYVSALSNSAALVGRNAGYLVWGVQDSTHAIVGTKFDPTVAKKGNEELLPWLIRMTSPRLDYSFEEVVVEGRRVVV